MVQKYNTLSPSPTTAHALTGDLLSSSPADLPQPDDFVAGHEMTGFDIVAVGLGFHHFHDPDGAIARLAERVSPGGVLLIVDFVEGKGWEDDFKRSHGHGHSHDHGHSHGHAHDHADAESGKETSSKVKALHTVRHHGFSEQRMKRCFEDAGLESVGWWVMEEEVEMRVAEGQAARRQVFFGRASRPLAA